MSEAKLSRISYTAASTPPICAGTTYSSSYSTGVNTLTPTFVTGAIANVAAGDIFLDLITGATGLIATVDTGGGTVTVNSASTLAGTPLAGSRAWEIHKAPSNLLTGNQPARPITVKDPGSVEWSYRQFSGTSSAVRPFVWNPGAGRWMGQGSGILTVTGGEMYETPIVVGTVLKEIGTGSTFAYNSSTGVTTITSMLSYWDIYAGCKIETAAGQQATVQCVDPTNSKIYLLGSLTLTAGVFKVLPKEETPALYWNCTTATGSPVAQIANRVLSR